MRCIEERTSNARAAINRRIRPSTRELRVPPLLACPSPQTPPMSSAPPSSHPLWDPGHSDPTAAAAAFDPPPVLHADTPSRADDHDDTAATASDHVQPHAFLPNLLRNWLWKPPPPREKAARRRQQQQQQQQRRKDSAAMMHDAQTNQPGTANRRLSKYSSATSTGVVIDDLNSSAATACTLYTRPPPLRLGGRSLRKLQAGGSNLSNPSSFALEGALLFVDMSGFTPLSERLGDAGMLGVEALSRCLNDYFGPITELIEQHGGDIIKFAGDAIMVLFCKDPFEQTTAAETGSSLASPTAAGRKGGKRPGCNRSRSSSASLCDLVHRAVVCASAVHDEFNNYEVTEGIVLKLHSAVSAGHLTACVVGGAFERYEFLLQGTPIFELAPALTSAQTGEVFLTDAAYQCAKEVVQAQEVRLENDEHAVAAAAATTAVSAAPIVAPLAAAASSANPATPRARGLNRSTSEASGSKLDAFLAVPGQRSVASPPHSLSPAGTSSSSSSTAAELVVPLTVPAVTTVWRFISAAQPESESVPVEAAVPSSDPAADVVRSPSPAGGRSRGGSGPSSAVRKFSLSRQSDELRPSPRGLRSPSPNGSLARASSNTNAAASFIIPSVLARVQDGQGQYLAEFRRMSTLFIGLPNLATHSRDPLVHTRALHELSSIVCLIQIVVFQARGEIRQLITDDKGTVLIAVFGLISHTHNPLRALKASTEIVEKLRAKGYAINIGLTTGMVFCGCIGTTHRCEYSFIGDRVNTAARLMVANAKFYGSGILSDDETLKTISLAASNHMSHVLRHSHMPDGAAAAIAASSAPQVKFGMSFQRRPPLMLKGKKQPFPVWQVAAASRAALNPAGGGATAPVRRGSTLLTSPNSYSAVLDHSSRYRGVLFRRSSLVHELQVQPANARRGDQSAQSANNNTVECKSDIVGRCFELELLKLRLVHACINNGFESRRKKKKEMRAANRAQQEAIKQSNRAPRRLKSMPSGGMTPTDAAPSGGLSSLSGGLRGRSSGISKSLPHRPPPLNVDDPAATPTSLVTSHGLIMIESVAGFGKSALLASLINMCSAATATSGPLRSPAHPQLNLHLEALVACGDEFNHTLPYFTLRSLIRCILGSFYRLESQRRKREAKVEREKRQEAEMIRLAEQQDAQEARNSSEAKSPTSDDATSRADAARAAAAALSSPSTNDSSDDEDDDADSIGGSGDRINLESFSFKDVDALGLPPTLNCMQHLHLLNEIVPGLRLPFIPPVRKVAHFHRLGSMSTPRRRQIPQGVEEGDENEADSSSSSESSSEGSSTEEEETESPSTDEPDALSPVEDDEDVATTAAAETEAAASSDAPSDPPPGIAACGSSDDDSLTSDSENEGSSSSSSDSDTSNHLLSCSIRSLHPGANPEQFNTLAARSMSSATANAQPTVMRMPLKSSAAADNRPRGGSMMDSPPPPPTMVLRRTKSVRPGSKLSSSKAFRRGEIEPASFSVWVSPPAVDAPPSLLKKKSMLTISASMADPPKAKVLSPVIASPEASPEPESSDTPPTLPVPAAATPQLTSSLELSPHPPAELDGGIQSEMDPDARRATSAGAVIGDATRPRISSASAAVAPRSVSQTPGSSTPQAGTPGSGRKGQPKVAPPLMSASAKSEALEMCVLELLETLLDQLHVEDARSLLVSGTPTRSNIAIFLDSVQWIDASSLNIILAIQRVIPSILFVCAGRNFSRNLHLLGKDAPQPTDSNGTPTSASALAPLTRGGSEQNLKVSQPDGAPATGSTASTSTTARVGNEIIRSAQQRGSIYVLLGDELRQQCEEKWAASLAARHAIASANPAGASAALPVPPPMIRAPFSPSLLYNLDYFDRIPANTGTVRSLASIMAANAAAAAAADKDTEDALPPASSPQLRRSQPRSLEVVESSVEDDPARDYENSLLLRLRGLSRADVQALICQRYGVDVVFGEVLDFIFSKSNGNCLFVAEMLHAMLDKGIVARVSRSSLSVKEEVMDSIELTWSTRIQAQGGLTFLLGSASSVVTESIEDLIGQRLDSLHPSHQLILKVCSVFGMEIYAEAVLRVIYSHDAHSHSHSSSSSSTPHHRDGSTTNSPHAPSSSLTPIPQPQVHRANSLPGEIAELPPPVLSNSHSHGSSNNLLGSPLSHPVSIRGSGFGSSPSPHMGAVNTKGFGRITSMHQALLVQHEAEQQAARQQQPVAATVRAPTPSGQSWRRSSEHPNLTVSTNVSSPISASPSLPSLSSASSGSGAGSVPPPNEMLNFVTSRMKVLEDLCAMEILRVDTNMAPGSTGTASDSDDFAADAADEATAEGVDGSYASYLALLNQLVPGVDRKRFTFHHMMMREVIYTRLPFSYRSAWHRTIAQWYEERFARNLMPVLSKLAHHWLLAAQCEHEAVASDTKHRSYKQAYHYLFLSGQNAASKAAAKEALDYFSQARDILDHVFPSGPRYVIPRKWKEVELLEHLIPCFSLVNGVPQSLPHYKHMLELVEELHGIPSKEARENRKALRFEARAKARLEAGDDVAQAIDDFSDDEDEENEELECLRSLDEPPCGADAVTEEECQSLLFVALLGVTAALANGPASLGKIANVSNKVRRLIAIARVLNNTVHTTDILLQAIMHFNFAGFYTRASIVGLQLIEKIDQAFVEERAKAKAQIKKQKEAERAAATSASNAATRPPSVSPLDMDGPPPVEGTLMMRQASEATVQAQERVEASMGAVSSAALATRFAENLAAQSKQNLERKDSTQVRNTLSMPMPGPAPMIIRPRSLFSPSMGGRMMTAWALANGGYIRLSLDLIAQLGLISQRLPGTHAALQAAGARRLVLGFLQDRVFTIADATKYLQAARQGRMPFNEFLWQLSLNSLRCIEATDQKTRRECMEDTWKRIDEGKRVSTMFSWLVCVILSFSSSRSSYTLGLKYTSTFWHHSFQAREETNCLAEMFRYRAGCWKQVWRERHTAAKMQVPYHQHACTGSAEASGALTVITKEAFRVDLPYHQHGFLPHVDPEDMPCSVILCHLFSCLYRSLLLSRTQHAALPELRAYITLLDVLDEVEHGILVEIRGHEAEQAEFWEPERSKRCQCQIGQGFIKLARTLGAQLEQLQLQQMAQAASLGLSVPQAPTHPSTSSVPALPTYGGSAGVLLQSASEWNEALHLRKHMTVDEYALYSLLTTNAAAVASADHTALLSRCSFLVFLSGIRLRSVVSLRSCFSRLIRPAHVANTLAELEWIEKNDRTARLEEQARKRSQKAKAQAATANTAAAPSTTAATATATAAQSDPVMQLPSPPGFSPPPVELSTNLSAPPLAMPPVIGSASSSTAFTGSSSFVAGAADSASLDLCLPNPLLGSMPRLAAGDRLGELELFQVAQLRMEDGKARAIFEAKQARIAAANPNANIKSYTPTFTRHFRRYPI